jgi:hypothetical protein
MKENDIETIARTAFKVINDIEPRAIEYIEKDRYEAFLVTCYLNIGQGKQTTIRTAITDYLTIIVTDYRVSVITDMDNGKRSSYYKNETPLCQFEVLYDDLYNLVMVIDTVLYRLGM